MLLPSYSNIVEASERIKSFVKKTPVVTSSEANDLAKAKEIFFKCENLQKGGSFKIRGAYNSIAKLSTQEKSNGVVTFSSGNHALAISLSAKEINVPGLFFKNCNE
jgi:threonine dehydratase